MKRQTPALVGILLLGFACGLHAAPTPIHEQSFVTIGGIEQWITITGANSDNPVVLFVHGGPGNAMSAYADSMYGGWEKDFTLVQWDQRGAGRTYGRSGPSVGPTLTLDRMAKDGVEVAEYLTTHLNKKRIVLVGGSWGSLLGVLIIKQRPSLFYAYVGTAQLVDMRENLTASYQRVFELANEFNNPTAIAELNGIGAPPWKSVARWQVFRKWRNDFQQRVARAPALKLVRSPEYENAQDLADDQAADNMSFAHFNFVGNFHDGAAHVCRPAGVRRGFSASFLCDPGRRGSERHTGYRPQIRQVDPFACEGIHSRAGERTPRLAGFIGCLVWRAHAPGEGADRARRKLTSSRGRGFTSP